MNFVMRGWDSRRGLAGDGHLVVVMMTVVVMVVAVTMMPAVAEMFSRSARLRLWAHYQAGRKYQQQY
jgi:uncharacterized protein HemY